jgi:hypothetical protein
MVNFLLSEDKKASDSSGLPVFGSFIDEHVWLYERPCCEIAKMRSLSKKLARIVLSQRHLTISVKVKTKCFISTRPKLLLDELCSVLHRMRSRSFTCQCWSEEMCRRKAIEYEERQPLRLSKKEDMIDWIKEKCNDLKHVIITMTGEQISLLALSRVELCAFDRV